MLFFRIMDKVTLTKLIKRARVEKKYSLIINRCKGKKVLDVGCIGQDAGVASGNWLHDQLKAVSSQLTGLDIVQEKIKKFRLLGYDMIDIQELEQRGDKYDVIVMADVIEHIGNPEEFLKYYSTWLTNGGSIIITTPNANRAINFVSIIVYGNYSVNDEHTCWFCPRTLHEVISRAGLNVQEFYWLDRYYSYRGLACMTRILTLLADMLAKCRRNLNHNFMFIISQ